MKILIFCAFMALIDSKLTFASPLTIYSTLNSKECTLGPTYWCQNLTTAANCRAVKHCIQTVWIYQQLPPDKSNVCQVCLDMVKQARDQLESNETQELIKEVFEGSCALLHIKPIVKECDTLVDEFAPELIESLASQMNPQVVCAVAGLCNNERVHKLIEAEKTKSSKSLDTCDGCHTVVGLMKDKFEKSSSDDFLQGMLLACRKTSSLADACSNIVISYFNQIYSHIRDNFNPNDFCLMSGECSAQFHVHSNVEITPNSHIGYLPIGTKDDLPCELCEQLVQHLRDLLVTNTTEAEFKQVLQGLCKQTRGFSKECLSLVEEYYNAAYDFLTDELDPNAVCSLISICPKNKTETLVPIMPLLTEKTAEKLLDIQPQSFQLPIERLTPSHMHEMYNTETCVFCEYFLHYLQQVITTPSTEEEIKEVIDKACSKLPSSINTTCVQFVDMYEPALVAILAQEIDPSIVCPLIRACPSAKNQDVEIFMKKPSDGSKCPLCLFAVSKLEQMIKEPKTEVEIKSALNKLCAHLSTDLATECNDFVNTYTEELIQLLLADLNAKEVCVYLKLCPADKPQKVNDVATGDFMTNVIIDGTINGHNIKAQVTKDSPQCVLCEFVMQQIQDELKNNATEDEIIKLVRNVCNKMPKTINTECNQFVDDYADTIIQLLIEATVPSELCRMIKLCDQVQEIKVEIFECAICETLVFSIEKILSNPNIDHNVEHVLEKACRALPRKDQTKCIEIIDKYGRTIYDLVIHLADKGLVCKEIGMCFNQPARPKIVKRATGLPGSNKCTWGPSYWCDSNENAQKCQALQHCREKVWFAQSKP